MVPDPVRIDRSSGLAWHTEEATLRQKFEEYGVIEEAVCRASFPSSEFVLSLCLFFWCAALCSSRLLSVEAEMPQTVSGGTKVI